MKLCCQKIILVLRIWFFAGILFANALLSLPSFSQYSDKQLKSVTWKSLNEELFMGTDRDIYISGEEVYVKVYCLNRLTHKPSALSKVVYVSLIDQSSNPVVQVKIGMNGSSGSGKLLLPDTLKTGNYYLSACTHWMQNYSPDFFSYKKISVVNPFQNIDHIRIPSYAPVADTVIFYPECGSIIKGTETTVGFRCLDRNKNPLDVTGFIINENNDTLCRVATNFKGYGIFSIHPDDTINLYLIVRVRNLSQTRFALPAVSSEGIVFTVEKAVEQHKMRIRILKNPGFDGSGKRYYLVYAPSSMSPFIKEFDPGKDTGIQLEINNLPPGLAALMITDDSEQIMAKRLIYNRPPEPGFTVNLEKNSFRTREKITAEIKTENIAGDPVESDLMVSVVKSLTNNITGQNSMCNHIQLPGPATDIPDAGQMDIDDQLIFYSGQNGLFTGFKTPDTELIHLPEPEGHLISGVAYNTITGEPLAWENLVLSIVGKTALCRFAKTDGKGVFHFIITESGKREIVIQPLRNELRNFYIELSSPFPETFNNYELSPFLIDTGKLAEINSAVISMQVQALYEPFRQEGTSNLDHIVKPSFYGEPEYELRLADYIELSSLKEVIKELIPVAFTETRKGKSNFRLINSNPDQKFLTDPFVMVDGVPFYDQDAVLKIAPSEIEKIDVLNTRYYIADICLEGIIDLKTVKGDLSVTGVEMPLFRQEFDAPSSCTRFQSPEYLTTEQRKSRIPDYRNTLYWNPCIRTDRSGKATVEFYSSDETGTYTIMVEGFTRDGAKGETAAAFKVISN